MFDEPAVEPIILVPMGNFDAFVSDDADDAAPAGAADLLALCQGKCSAEQLIELKTQYMKLKVSPLREEEKCSPFVKLLFGSRTRSPSSKPTLPYLPKRVHAR